MPVTNASIKALLTGRLGANGNTTYVDEFANTWTGTTGAALTSSSPMYAPLSLSIPNTTSTTYWSLPNAGNAGFVLGSGNFRVKVWINQTTASTEAVYIDNDGQNGTAGWRIGVWNAAAGGSGYSIYWYSDVGGFFDFPLSVQPGATGNRFFMFERVGTAANNVSVYDGATRVGQYTDNTNYSRQATNTLLGRGANNLAFRPFRGLVGGVEVWTGAGVTSSGTPLAGIPSPYDYLSTDTPVNPDVGALALAGFSPTLAQTANQALLPGAGPLGLAGYAPTVSQSSGLTLTPGAGSVALTGYAPTLARTANQALVPGVGAATLTGYAPAVTQASASVSLVPGVGSMTLTGWAPEIGQTGKGAAGYGHKPKQTPKQKRAILESIRADNMDQIVQAFKKQPPPQRVTELNEYDDDEEEALMLLM